MPTIPRSISPASLHAREDFFAVGSWYDSFDQVDTGRGRGVIGVIDGGSPAGIETEEDVAARTQLLRSLGYKLG